MRFYEAALNEGGAAREPLIAGTYKDLVIKNYKDPKEGSDQRKWGVVSKSRNGWANLKLTLKDEWFDDAICAIAFGKEQEALASKELTAKEVERAQKYIATTVAEALEKANTPAEEQAEAAEKQTKKTLTAIRINIGTFLRLQKYRGLEPALINDPLIIVGAQFHGSIKPDTGYGLEVGSVYAIPKDFTPPVDDTSFAEATRG